MQRSKENLCKRQSQKEKISTCEGNSIIQSRIVIEPALSILTQQSLLLKYHLFLQKAFYLHTISTLVQTIRSEEKNKRYFGLNREVETKNILFKKYFKMKEIAKHMKLSIRISQDSPRPFVYKPEIVIRRESGQKNSLQRFENRAIFVDQKSSEMKNLRVKMKSKKGCKKQKQNTVQNCQKNVVHVKSPRKSKEVETYGLFKFTSKGKDPRAKAKEQPKQKPQHKRTKTYENQIENQYYLINLDQMGFKSRMVSPQTSSNHSRQSSSSNLVSKSRGKLKLMKCKSKVKVSTQY